MSDSEHWSIQNSAALYGLDRWGDPYFSINGRGHISVQPQGDRGGSLDLVVNALNCGGDLHRHFFLEEMAGFSFGDTCIRELL